ncbi:hypothetical protein [Streptomyces rapamycinicus]|uniref:Uncharacterized protein n=2 Tax=Streptomyces rapamycinicus TaxID=1226757 RepID=A0A0A0NKP9_STRRN|nr:hypothetical protein [Streptomyces rapamycinicus]AGP57539.1 hypothetical protein M271_30520 [Streptomyces rapamycinicus NRRL 5491]MBB4785199.1 hypothetical protein [Streptomyces rapamycinicus]RLV79329.1 hypothetical protein D3C57_113130 [Streptomyces rapamycinicus NRRL 5491]UTO65410.1 hypothetical protein LJB45_25870 [Streptomyces rapamycinicus]UTP33366.1 hypothetical protein LIV37_31000 [Streptomyces rapamycinicus NRRL 5491]
MQFIKGFLPWVAFAGLAAFGWQWASLGALVVSTLVLVKGMMDGYKADALVLEYSNTLFFALWTVLAFADTNSPAEHLDGPVSMAWLAATAWGSIVFGHPFTTGLAKRDVPPDMWNHPGFIRTNLILTRVWATAFSISTLTLGLVVVADLNVAFRVFFQVTGLVVPAIVTVQYPKRVQARMNDAMVQGVRS